MLVPLNITGSTHKSRDLSLSAQLTRNFYPEVQENESTKERFTLAPFPGLSLFGTASGTNRGLIFHAGSLFKITGTQIYTVASSGAHTSVGSVPGTSRCVIEPIGSKLVIVSAGNAYEYDSGIMAITDSDLESPDSAAHLNNTIIFDGDGGRFVVSDVGDATSIDGLNYATAEVDADSLLRVYSFEQVAYMLGEKTIEPWYFSGIGRPPVDRIQGGIMEVGLGALHSVDSNEKAMYFLGSDNGVYRIVNGQLEDVMPFNVRREIGKLTVNQRSAATGFCFRIVDQNFYQINFSTVSWCFHENSRQWFTVGEPEARSLMDGYAFAFGKHLVTDYRNGNIYELDPEVYTVNNNEMTRERVTGPLHGGLVGAPGKEIEVNRFQVLLAAGSGSVTNPKVMLQTSPDGKTWSTEMWENAGNLGDFLYEVEFGPLGAQASWHFRIKVSSAYPWSIHGAAADIEIGI